ncbi:MAG: ABC transporter permease [Saprospiraceae bacterium]|nr:ABC transporter permease [Saprospiraceae bacterium]
MEKWTEVITPNRGLLSLRLGELWRYRNLVMMFVRRDFVTYYKQTILGPLWFFIEPVFIAAVNLFVFGGLAKIGPAGVPGFLFYLSGPILWNYFQDSLLKSADTFKAHQSIFGKVYFPRLVIPLSIVVSNLLKLGVQLSLLLLAVLYVWGTEGQLYLQPQLYLLPVIIVLIAGLGMGFGILISSLTTKYRDLSFLVNFGVPLLKYITPGIATTYAIFLDKLPAWKLVAQINPVGHLIDAFNFIFTGAGEIDPWRLGYSFSVMLVVLFFGVIVFNKTEQNFIDTV